MSNIALQPGDILIEKNNGFFGWFIKTFTGGDYQHARVVLKETDKTLEDVWYGVAITKAPDLSSGKFEVWRPNCSEDIKLRAIDIMDDKLGEAYGYGQLFVIWLKKISGVKIPDANGMVCSQIIAWGYENAGYDLDPVNPDNLTAPWDLRNESRSVRIL